MTSTNSKDMLLRVMDIYFKDENGKILAKITLQVESDNHGKEYVIINNEKKYIDDYICF